MRCWRSQYDPWTWVAGKPGTFQKRWSLKFVSVRRALYYLYIHLKYCEYYIISSITTIVEDSRQGANRRAARIAS